MLLRNAFPAIINHTTAMRCVHFNQPSGFIDVISARSNLPRTIMISTFNDG